MRMHRRTAVVVATITLVGGGLLGLTACAGGAAATGSAAAADELAQVADVAAELDVEEQALTALGFTPTEVAVQAETAPAASASPGSDGRRQGERRRPLRREMLRGRVLHAEAVVQTKNGVQTILSQHGTITAINDSSVTVKSADGYTMTWSFGKNLRVVERRRTVQPTDLAVGVEVGVAGAKQGDAGVAGLIVRREKK